jgi:dolichol-phosphate mannosyltransferase
MDLAPSVLIGVEQASGDLIGVMDADLSHPPELLPALVKAVRSGAQVAVASRYIPGGRIVNWPWTRRFLSWAGNVVARPLVQVADATSGYFVCPAELVRALPRCPQGFKILLELLVRNRVRTAQEVPYVFVDRRSGRSKLRLKTLGRYALQLAALYRHQ